jgi:hypothetical protein
MKIPSVIHVSLTDIHLMSQHKNILPLLRCSPRNAIFWVLPAYSTFCANHLHISSSVVIEWESSSSTADTIKIMHCVYPVNPPLCIQLILHYAQAPIPWKSILFFADPPTICPLHGADPLESNPLHRRSPKQYILFMVPIPWKAILFIADLLESNPLHRRSTDNMSSSWLSIPWKAMIFIADLLESNPLHRRSPRYILFMVPIPWKAVLFIADPPKICPLHGCRSPGK